ncbi:hypothetical protein pb186bvf_004723 [Paramecium bursaria]
MTDPYQLLQQSEDFQDYDRLLIENVVIYDLKDHDITVVQILNEDNTVLKTIQGLQQYSHREQIPKDFHNDQENNIAVKIYDGPRFKLAYIKAIDSYLIHLAGSTILIRDENDFDKFGAKHNHHLDVAEFWFKELKKLNQEEQELLKLDLQGRTLIGTLIGSEESIIINERFGIVFSEVADLDIREALKFYAHYGLPIPYTQAIPTGKVEFQNLLDRIHRNDTDLEYAGSVLHIGKNKYVVENIEYKILNSLKIHLLNESSTEKEFQQSARDLINGQKIARPIEFYLKIFQYIKPQMNYKLRDFTKKDFPVLINIILHNIQQQKKFNPQQLQDVAFWKVKLQDYNTNLTRVPVFEKKYKNPEIFVVLFLGLPGMGSSTLAKSLGNIIHEDDLDKLDFKKLPDQSIFILESNLNPESLNNLLAKLKDRARRYVITQINEKFEDSNYELPFSLDFFLSSLKRFATTSEQISNYMYQVPQFEKLVLQKIDCEAIIQFPFVNVQGREYSNDILNVFLDVFDASIHKKCKDKKLLSKFADLLKNEEIQYNYPENFQEEVSALKKQLFPFLKKTKQIQQKTEEHKPKKEKQQKYVYNPTYLPKQLAILIQNKYTAKDKLNRWIKECLNEAQTKFAADEDFKSVQTAFQNDQYQFENNVYLQLLQITSLDDESIRELRYFKEFQPDKEVEINIKTLFISLEGLIVGLVNKTPFPAQNPYPHIVFYSREKGLKSQNSTEFISQAINQNQALKQIIKDGNKAEKYIYKENIKLKNKVYQVFVISLPDELVLDGKSTDRL